MPFNVNDFITSMQDDGARPNLFQVTLTLPPSVSSGDDTRRFSFKAKAASIPGSSIGIASEFYFGRQVKYAGDRQFTEWAVTVINNEDYYFRTKFERWLSKINNHVHNYGTLTYLRNYAVNALVSQYARDSTPTAIYEFKGLYPIDISPMGLDWGANDQIEEFGVTFAYQWWERMESTDSVSRNIV